MKNMTAALLFEKHSLRIMVLVAAIVALTSLGLTASAGAEEPVHLVIKSFNLDFSSIRNTNPTTPCSIAIDSTLVVANEGTAGYIGGYNDALIAESCSSSVPLSCGGIIWGGLVPIYQLAKGASVTYTPLTTAQKAPFTVNCSPPSPNYTILGGSIVAKWASCRAGITCDPGLAVATEDLLTVCSAAKQKNLLSACH